MSDLNIVGSNNPPPAEPSSFVNPTIAATLPIGTPVVWDSTANDQAKAGNASAIASSFMAGLLAQPSTAAERALVQTRGPVSLTTAQWDALVTGQSGGLTRGPYYLSAAAAGKLVVAQPAGGGDVVVLVGYAISPTQMVLAGCPSTPVAEGGA